MANIINGSADADGLNGLSGDNVINGLAGADKLNGGAGLDTLDGGSGSDTISGNSGNDTLIYRAAENAGSTDVYDGGSGKDYLQLNLTLAEWNSAAVQTDIASYLNFIDVNTQWRTLEANNAEFHFTAFNLAASKIEFLRVVVDGAVLSPEDNAVTLGADSMSATENGAGTGANLFANDSVPDQVKTFTFTQAAHGAVSIVQDFSVVNAPSAVATYTPTGTYWDYLSAGQTATDSFTYTVTDADNDTQTATVTVTVTGTNDVVSITSSPQAGAVVEDAAATPSLTDSLNASGAVAFTDVDLADTHSATFAASPANLTSLGTFALGSVSEALNAASGLVGWTYALNNAGAQYLAAGQAVTETYTVTVNDGHGATTTQDVVITITGTNDDPVITAQDLAGGVLELVTPTGNLSDSGVIGFTDVDLTDVHLVSPNGAPVGTTLGALTAVKDSDTTTTGTGGQLTWTYTVPAAAVEYLAAGQTKVESFTITLDDQHGGLLTRQIDVTVTGTNDVVSITSAPQAGAVVEDPDSTPSPMDALNAAGTVAFTDVDLSDTHSATFAASPANLTSLGTFALGSVSEAPNAASGSVGWTYALNNAGAQYLAAGQAVTETYTVTVDDGHGSTTTQDVVVMITGTNDAVTITSGPQAGGVVEDGSLNAAGTVAFSDVDLSDTHSLSFVASPGNTTSLGTFALGAVSEGPNAAAGSVGWTYGLNNAAAQSLAGGQVVTETYTVTVDDSHGSTTTQAVVITITGTNDAPVITLEAGDSASAGLPETNAGLLADGHVTVTDVDAGDVATLSVDSVSIGAAGTGATTVGLPALQAMMSVGQDGGWHFNSGSEAFNNLAAGQTLVLNYLLRADDGDANDTQTVTVTITGTNDAPVITLEAGDSASAGLPETNAGLLADGHVTVTDVDAGDVATLSVDSVSIGAASTGATAVGLPALQAMMSVGQDGGWHFNSGSEAFNNLAAGQTLVLNYLLKADDGDANDTQTVTVTITGTNDAPVAATLIDQSSNEDTAFSFTAPASTDVDSASLTYTATKDDGSALPSWLNFDATTRTFSGTPPQDFNGAIAVKMVTSDGSLTDSKTFNLTINPVNDAPVAVADTLAATEDTPVTYTAAQLLGNDTDVDNPNAALSIASVTSGVGGTAVLNLDGTVSFTPGANFNGAADFSYTTTDGSLTSAPATVTVNVAAVNDAPVAVADTLAATEDTPVTYTAAQLLGNDTDVDNPNAALSIASVTSGTGGVAVLNPNGTVSFTPGANFNGPASFTYTTTDGALASGPATVTVNVAAVNDGPVFTSGTTGSVAENSAISTVVYDANVTDVDGAPAVFSLTGTDAGLFNINSATGEVTFKVSPNFEGPTDTGANNVYDFSVSAFDGAATTSQAVAVTVTNVNEAPLIDSNGGGANATVPVNENTTAVTTVHASDPDAGTTLVYSISGGADAGKFTINGATGVLSFISAPNFEAPTDADANNSYIVQVRAFDGALQDDQTITVNVADVAEAPVDTQGPTSVGFTLAGGGATTDNGASLGAGDAIGTFVAQGDPNSSVFHYALTGANAGLFTLNTATGALAIGGSALTSSATPYALTVTALDQANNAFSQVVKVWVGGSGDQLLVGVGADVDLQYGMNGNDTLNGGAGNDALVGGAAGDLLIGGGGSDQLFGAANSDSFRFNGPGDATDKILDFEITGGNTDIVQLGAPGFSLQNQAGAGGVSMVDADVAASSISGADIVRWTGPAGNMDSAAEVNAMLAGKASTFAGGVFVLGFDAAGKVALWYDDSANNAASSVTMVATFDNLTSTSTFTADNFLFV